MQDLPQNLNEENELTLREQIETYLRYWPWFLGTVIIALIAASIYLRYAVTTYNTTATILIKNEGNKNLSELAAFQDLGIVGTLTNSDFDNEIEILKSKNLTEKVVEELNLQVRYYKEGNIRDAEVYANRPFTVQILSLGENLTGPTDFLYIKPLSDILFELRGGGKEPKTYSFGEPITFEWGSITVVPNLEVLKNDDTNSELRVGIAKKDAVVGSLRNRIMVSPVSKNSSVIKLEMVSAVPEKARDILDVLINQYNQDAINDRNMVSRNTANFIERRLAIITDELDSVESGKVEFKEANRLTDIAAEGQLFLENASEFKKRQLEVETQIALVNTMQEYLKNGSAEDLLPANLGVQKEGFSSEVERYNQLVLERNKLLQSSTEKNPLVQNLEGRIREMRQNVEQSLSNVKNSLEIQRDRLNRQEARIGGEISAIPAKEKQFRSISRQQEIKEALYLYLLQKREETAISLAVTTPKAKIVDHAYTLSQPVSPKRQIILLAAIILGLLIPFLIIYLKQLLDNKIRNRAYVERFGANIPIVGEIPELSKKDKELVENNDYSILAESFRILQTNLQYLVLNKKGHESKGKVILVTSTVKGEGKTFVSANLAITLANSGAKVALVGADLRNPQLQRYLKGEYNNKGVVDYLVYPETTIEDYLQPSNTYSNLWLLVSGTIPPNPAELWMRERTNELFAELNQKFDYIVVDTAPVMLVTDTLLINKYADIMLYALRAGYTEKKLLDFPVENERNNKLKNLAFVLNNVSMANFGYGNKYGYTYGSKKIGFWQKMFRSIKW